MSFFLNRLAFLYPVRNFVKAVLNAGKLSYDLIIRRVQLSNGLLRNRVTETSISHEQHSGGILERDLAAFSFLSSECRFRDGSNTMGDGRCNATAVERGETDHQHTRPLSNP